MAETFLEDEPLLSKGEGVPSRVAVYLRRGLPGEGEAPFVDLDFASVELFKVDEIVDPVGSLSRLARCEPELFFGR